MPVTLLENDFLCRLFVCVYTLGLSLMTIDTHRNILRDIHHLTHVCLEVALFPHTYRTDLSVKTVQPVQISCVRGQIRHVSQNAAIKANSYTETS